MDADALCTAAREETGHEDFGPETFRAGLEVLVRSLRDEAQLNDLGVAALEAQIGLMLRNRLAVVAWATTHPEVRAAPVERPIVVIGLPRTGTTHLSCLLACDPGLRPLLHWEATRSVPPPDATTLRTDPRVEEARIASGLLDQLNPGFRAIHHEDPDGPTECVTLLAQDFRSLLWETLANVPTYSEWLLASDPTPAYEYHRLALQVLQSRAPGRWSLKTPHHCLALPALVAQYPDARFVMTHRDPLTVTASVCSLVRSLAGTFSDADHRRYCARHWPEVLATCTDRVVDYRARHGDEAFLDVAYADLLADPLGVAQRIYDHVGAELTPAVGARMRAYLDAAPQGRFGRHDYELGELLLDEGVRDRFAGYLARFGASGAAPG